MEDVGETPKFAFGNVGNISTVDAGLYVRAGAELGFPISVKPTKGIDLDDPNAKTYWRVFSGRPLKGEEAAALEEKVSVLLQEELKTQG